MNINEMTTVNVYCPHIECFECDTGIKVGDSFYTLSNQYGYAAIMHSLDCVASRLSEFYEISYSEPHICLMTDAEFTTGYRYDNYDFASSSALITYLIKHDLIQKGVLVGKWFPNKMMLCTKSMPNSYFTEGTMYEYAYFNGDHYLHYTTENEAHYTIFSRYDNEVENYFKEVCVCN